ncbi:CYTH domain-containing protein [Isoalcanivorax beigongshangi]|uniref:CYTH domain-containing protein n=1 Tax=Isoalcanivorax beigongshangi TaxID=3238810 RepID=A0ABV4AKL0_9GAMM
MAIEIERKFLLRDLQVLQGLSGQRIAQGYLSHSPTATVRVRLRDGHGWLTVKGLTAGLQRDEFEYPIPAADAEALLALCDAGVIDKTRYLLPADGGLCWEIDVFHGDNDGLVVAEIELPSADHPLPAADWLGAEVSHDPRYFNSALSRTPYRHWTAR